MTKLKQLKKKIEEILDKNNKDLLTDRPWNAKEAVDKLLSLCKEHALSVLPNKKPLIKNIEHKGTNIGDSDLIKHLLEMRRWDGFNQAIKQAKDLINEKPI